MPLRHRPGKGSVFGLPLAGETVEGTGAVRSPNSACAGSEGSGVLLGEGCFWDEHGSHGAFDEKLME